MPLSNLLVSNNSYKISYKIFNLQKTTDIVFLHGWGSNKEIMHQVFALNNSLNDFRLIFVDLPGFGQSSNNSVLDSYGYLHILEEFFIKNNIKKDVIVGHSFGGKIACLLNPKKLVLLSSAGIVVEKSLSVKIKIYLFKMFRFMGLSFMYKILASSDVKYMSKNMYETFKKVVDEDFKEIFAKYSNKALIFWGIEDKQTPLSSGETISLLIKNSKFKALNGEHFFFADKKNANEISEQIQKLIIEA